jgi:hypothetical protein
VSNVELDAMTAIMPHTVLTAIQVSHISKWARVKVFAFVEVINTQMQHLRHANSVLLNAILAIVWLNALVALHLLLCTMECVVV